MVDHYLTHRLLSLFDDTAYQINAGNVSILTMAMSFRTNVVNRADLYNRIGQKGLYKHVTIPPIVRAVSGKFYGPLVGNQLPLCRRSVKWGYTTTGC